MNLAQGDINGIQPVPKTLSNEILFYLKMRGYSNATTGKTRSTKGRSQQLSEAGVDNLTIEEYFDGDAASVTSKNSLLHVSFWMELYNISGQGQFVHIYPAPDPADPFNHIEPLVSYEKMVFESKMIFLSWRFQEFLPR